MVDSVPLPSQGSLFSSRFLGWHLDTLDNALDQIGEILDDPPTAAVVR
jgi:hypothetical protein